jgi:hypothetical protein
MENDNNKMNLMYFNDLKKFEWEDDTVSYHYENNKLTSDMIKNPKRLYKVDRKCDKLVVVSNPGGSGANFVINCLSFSNSVNFRNFNLNQKLSYFRSALLKEKGRFWQDYFCMHLKVNENPDKLINSNDTVMFLKLHPYVGTDLTQSLEFWNNSKHVILFENFDLFKKIRYGYGWDGLDEKFLPITFEQYAKMNPLQRNDIRTSLFPVGEYDDDGELIENNVQIGKTHDMRILIEKYPDKIFHHWNVDWLLSEEDTLENIKNFYDLLGLEGYNEQIISVAYKMWMVKLDEFKKNIATYWSTGIG